MKKKLLNKKIVFLFAFIFIFSLCFMDGHMVKATEDKPDIKITVTTNKSEALVNEEIEVKYKIEPQPIDIRDINEKKDKEIILVVDTSGSMNDKLDNKQTRIEALKDAAINFVDKFKEEDNVKIGIVDYNYCAEQSVKLVSSKKEQQLLKESIYNLKAEGATNIGDGIRVAAKMFSKDPSVKKYLVLMSDGMPTTLSYKANLKYWKSILEEHVYGEFMQYSHKMYRWNEDVEENNKWDYFGIDDDIKEIKIGNYGYYDPKGYCLKYSKLMAQELKKNNITNYVIGFSGGSDSTKLKQIAESSAGSYYDARDAKAINEVYSKIGDQIKEDYTVEDVKINFNLPEGMECSINNSEIFKQGNGYIKSIPNIIYRLNEQKTQYIADSFEIIIKIKATKSGKYEIGKGWQLAYKGINNNVITKSFPNVDITVDKYNIDFEVSRKLLPETGDGQFNINKEFEMKYVVTPKPIAVEISEESKDILIAAKLIGTLPEGFTIVDSEKLSFDKDLKVNYRYNIEKKQYKADAIEFIIKVVPSKMGNYYLKDDANFYYTDLEGEEHSKKINPLNISIIDDYVVKQGLFQKDETYKGNYPGENNIKYLENISIVSDNLTRLGAFIRTSGQQTNVNIDINPNGTVGIKSLYDLKVNVFKADDKGRLHEINANTSIEGNNGSSAKILVNLPEENTKGYSYYIVNYNFKVNKSGDSNINMISRCEIVGTNRSSDLGIKIGELPDLF